MAAVREKIRRNVRREEQRGECKLQQSKEDYEEKERRDSR